MVLVFGCTFHLSKLAQKPSIVCPSTALIPLFNNSAWISANFHLGLGLPLLYNLALRSVFGLKFGTFGGSHKTRALSSPTLPLHDRLTPDCPF